MVVNDSLHSEQSTKRRRCLIGEERKLNDPSLAKEAEEVSFHQEAALLDRKVTTVFIGGLHPRILQAHLEKMCQPYGTIERLHFCDKKGYAFCEYTNSEQAEAAMQALDGRGLLGRRLMVRPAHDQQHTGNHARNASSSAWQNRSSTSSSSKNDPEKEKNRIEAKIAAVKRKLQDAQT